MNHSISRGLNEGNLVAIVDLIQRENYVPAWISWFNMSMDKMKSEMSTYFQD